MKWQIRSIKYSNSFLSVLFTMGITLNVDIDTSLQLPDIKDMIFISVIFQIIFNLSRKLNGAVVKCEVSNAVGISSETKTLEVTCKFIHDHI